jgi:hypothetical protein
MVIECESKAFFGRDEVSFFFLSSLLCSFRYLFDFNNDFFAAVPFAFFYRFGANIYPKPPPKGWFSLLLEALKDTTLIILMVAAAVSLALGLGLEDPSTGWIEGELND